MLPTLSLHPIMRKMGIPNKYHPFDIIHYVITYGCLFLAGCTYEINGLENVRTENIKTENNRTENNKNKPYIVCSNHNSNLDIPVLYMIKGLSLRFIMKKELLKLYPPVFYPAKWSGHICIDRKDIANSIKQFKLAGQQMKECNYSTVIFPEGTRNNSHKILLPFKKGAFHLAHETGIDILPIVITGPKECWPSTCWWGQPCHIKVDILEPIIVEDMNNNKTKNVEQLLKETENVLSTHIRNNPSDYHERNVISGILPALLFLSLLFLSLIYF